MSRSDPDKIDVNVRCIDEVDLATLKLEYFDGKHWEDASLTAAINKREVPTHAARVPDLANRIVGHYEKHAVAWDRDRQSNYWNDKIWHDRFIGRLGQGVNVLDLGCGSGRPVAQHMVEHGVRVTGVDSSPTMISLCRDRLPDQEWIVADMRQLVHGRRFDGILAWDSFFHLNHDDQRQMFPIFMNHAAVGAVLMFNTGSQHGEGVGEYKGDPLYHASLSPDEYETLVARFEFRVLEHARTDAQAGGRTVWLCQRNESS